MGWVCGITTAMYIDAEYITFLPSMVYLCGSEEGTLQILGHMIGKLLAAKLSHSPVTCFRFIHHAPLSAQTTRQQPQQQPPNAAISLSTSKKAPASTLTEAKQLYFFSAIPSTLSTVSAELEVLISSSS